MEPKTIKYNVVVIGAGISGIGAGYHLQTKCPHLNYTIFEARSDIGGTWDLFKYPGIRSDSDMYTFGFSFYPWRNPKAIADGPAIMEYINETVDHFNIRPKIQFQHKVTSANWSSDLKKWIISVEDLPHSTTKIVHCDFLFTCTGYYDYEKGYEPAFPNSNLFNGTLVHPQKWDETIDYTNKKVVIIGSGATAVTLVPEMAKTAARVTMLQRTPSYIVDLPGEDSIANFFKRIFPQKTAHHLSRWKNILFSLGFYLAARQWPLAIKKMIKDDAKKTLGDHYQDKDFDPPYNPWDQRLCIVPDNDLFVAIKSGKASMVTDTIDSFTPSGIRTTSGQHLDADIIVTATGLKIQLFGGMELRVNQQLIHTAEMHAYKGVMLSDIPNFAVAVGYTNASWTLKVDLNCHFVTKVLNYMKKQGYEVCTPRFDTEEMDTERLLDFDAGYILRANDILPKQGSKAPWKVYQNYVKDLFSLKYGKVNDRYLEYE